MSHLLANPFWINLGLPPVSFIYRNFLWFFGTLLLLSLRVTDLYKFNFEYIYIYIYINHLKNLLLDCLEKKSKNCSWATNNMHGTFLWIKILWRRGHLWPMSYSSIGTISSNNNGIEGEVMVSKLNRFVLTNKNKRFLVAYIFPFPFY